MDRRRFLASSFATSIAAAPLLATRGRASAVLSSAIQQAEGASTQALPASLREKLMHDPLRPQFHLLPGANWMNDPCAPRFFRGQYHMFFQYNPGAAVWGDMHWAHATSPDLIHWKHLPVALSPTPGSYDSSGCFTGSVLPGAEIPSILYTGVTKTPPEEETIRGEGLREVQCLATSTDPELRVWKKLDKPVLDAPPPGLKVTGFRDPCPWKDGDTWFLIVGSGFSKTGGAVLVYRSADGRNWEYLHPLAQGKWNGSSMTNPVDTGEMWECPDFFPLGDKHVLLYSSERKVYWEVGSFDKSDFTFHSETKGMLDHGSYYAMKSMMDAKGRRILWGWVEETRSPEDCKAAGWAGAMALPRVLTLGTGNELKMDVPPEFALLLHDTQTIRTPLKAEALARMHIRNRAGKISCGFKAGQTGCGLELRNGTNPEPLFAIGCDGTADKPSVNIGGKSLPLSPGSDGSSTLNLWIDGSVIEVFLDSREAMTARCYTLSSGDIQIAWTGAESALQSLSVSAVRPISADRLTT